MDERELELEQQMPLAAEGQEGMGGQYNEDGQMIRNGPHNPTNRFFEPLAIVIEDEEEEDKRSEELLDQSSGERDDNSEDEIID